MVVDVVRAYARKVRYEKARVEGAHVDERLRQEADAVEPPYYANQKARKAAELLDKNVHHLVERVCLACLAVLINICGDLLLHIEHVVRGKKVDLRHRVAAVRLQNDHGDLDILVLIDFPPLDEAVERRKFFQRMEIRREHQRQMADLLSLFPLFVHIGTHGHFRNVQRDHIHRIIPLRKKMRDEIIHGILVLYQGSVRTHNLPSLPYGKYKNFDEIIPPAAIFVNISALGSRQKMNFLLIRRKVHDLFTISY